MSKKCIVVGSGPSAYGFVPPKDVLIIGVNGTVEWLPRMDWWFTLDHSKANMERIAHPREGVNYAVAFPDTVPTPPFVHRYARHEERGPEPKLQKTAEWYLWRWRCVLGLSHTDGVINSGNSAYGAIGLAYHLGYTDIGLIGVDGSQKERIEGGKPNVLTHLPLLIKSAERNGDVKLTSFGAIKGIRKSTIADWLKEE